MALPIEMRRLPLLLLATTFAAPSAAQAAGFYLTDVGTRGLARGGAFVAAPDSLLAINYNPAALSQLKGLHVLTDLTLVNLDLRFERKCPCAPPGSPDAAAIDQQLESTFNQNPATANTVLAIPFLGVGYGLPILDLTFGLGVWGPTSGRHNWGELPATSAPSFVDTANREVTRYSGLEMRTLEANLALGVGLRPLGEVLPGLRVGATLFGFQSGNRQTVSFYANTTFAGAEDPRFDVPAVLDFLEPAGINWQIAASYELLPGLTFGTTYRGKRSFTAEGTLTAQVPAELADQVKVEGEQVEVTLATAPIWRSGLEYRMPGLFRAEAAFVWEGWSAHDQVVIAAKDITISLNNMPVPLPVISVPREWQDSWSLRLGGEVNLLEPFLGIQAGWYYEPTAIAPQRVDPSRVDLDKQGFSLGLNTTFFGFTLTVAGQVVLLSGIEVRDGARKVIAPLEDNGVAINPEVITTINNGNYSGQYFIGSVSLSFALDPLMGAL